MISDAGFMADQDWRKTLEDWIRDHAEAVFAYLYRLAGSTSAAEDLSQEVFLTALRKGSQIRDPEKVRAWLLAVARNAYLASRRASQASPIVELPEPAEIADDDAADGHWAFDEERLREALAELPDDYRVVVLMFYFEELSYREIAEYLQLPIGTIMSRLSRAKVQLRIKLAGSVAATPSLLD
ncbi:MAG: RNA polymerase sigma factor [Thermogutta sp.]